MKILRKKGYPDTSITATAWTGDRSHGGFPPGPLPSQWPLGLFAAFLATLLTSQVTGLAVAEDQAPIVFSPRPRVAYSKAEMDAWRSEPDRASERQQIVERASKILEQELYVPTKEGDWSFYYACSKDGSSLQAKSMTEHVCPKCGSVYTDERTNAAYRTILSNRLESDMYGLALAYALTGEDTYALPVRKAFLKLVQVYSTLERHDRWGRKGMLAVVGGRRYCQHLDEAVSAILLSKAYDFVAESPVLWAPDRQTIEQSFLGATVREIQKYRFFVDPKGMNNHITWFNAAYANVGLAIGDAALLREAVYGKHGLMYQLSHSVTEDGLWYEGTLAYHFYALSALQETLHAIKRIGWDLSDNERLKSLYLGPLRMAYPDGTFPVMHDSDPACLAQWWEFYRFAADYFKDPLFVEYANPQSSEASKKPQPKSAAMKGIGIVALRRGQGRDAVCAMIDYGLHGGHHGHPDKLNLVLYALGRELVLDPGRITYSVPEYETWARTTVAHNTVVIDHRNQEPTEGQLVYFRDTKDYTACLCVSRDAYPGFTLKRFLILTNGWLADVSSVQEGPTATMDWVLHVRGKLAEPVLADGANLVGDPLPEGTLGKSSGYEHLRDVLRWDCKSSTAFHYRQPDGRVLGVHCLEPSPAAVYTGIGIGYRLDDAVPFLLRRRGGKGTCFVTVCDLTGTGDSVKTVQTLPAKVDHQPPPVGDALRLRIKTAAADYDLRLDLRDKAGDNEGERVEFRLSRRRKAATVSATSAQWARGANGGVGDYAVL